MILKIKTKNTEMELGIENKKERFGMFNTIKDILNNKRRSKKQISKYGDRYEASCILVNDDGIVHYSMIVRAHSYDEAVIMLNTNLVSNGKILRIAKIEG